MPPVYNVARRLLLQFLASTAKADRVLRYGIVADTANLILSVMTDIAFADKYDIAPEDRVSFISTARFIVASYLDRDPLDGCSFHGDPRRIPLVRPGKSLRGQPPGVGVPIGDVINQLFSNIYLNPLDQFIRRELHLGHSVRYVDDGKALHGSRAYLEDCVPRIGGFLSSELGLRLHPDKTRVSDICEGIRFLGAVVLPYRRYAQNNTVTAFKDYVRHVDEMLSAGVEMNLDGVVSRLNSRLGYLSHFRERRLVWKTVSASRAVCARFSFSPDLSKVKLIKTHQA